MAGEPTTTQDVQSKVDAALGSAGVAIRQMMERETQLESLQESTGQLQNAASKYASCKNQTMMNMKV